MVTTNIVVPSLFSLSAKKTREKKNEKRDLCAKLLCMCMACKKVRFFKESPHKLLFGSAKVVLVLSRLNLKFKILGDKFSC